MNNTEFVLRRMNFSPHHNSVQCPANIGKGVSSSICFESTWIHFEFLTIRSRCCVEEYWYIHKYNTFRRCWDRSVRSVSQSGFYMLIGWVEWETSDYCVLCYCSSRASWLERGEKDSENKVMLSATPLLGMEMEDEEIGSTDHFYFGPGLPSTPHLTSPGQSGDAEQGVRGDHWPPVQNIFCKVEIKVQLLLPWSSRYNDCVIIGRGWQWIVTDNWIKGSKYCIETHLKCK